jgi:selenide, water dikinase
MSKVSQLATSHVRLTQQTKAGGCASKLAPGKLAKVLSRLPSQTDPNVLVGFSTSDDAGVYRIGPDSALVQTIDFFTPMVDDPFVYGQIAATNALSDVYAMGGRPLTALSVLCFPADGDLDVLEQVMRGGMSKMNEAGCIVLGGHSVRDTEMKFGYAVTGLVDPARVYTNAGARAGDVLLFTKALGTGVITTALKQGKSDPKWVDAAVRSMTTLNKTAGEILAGTGGVHAVTDVTGFGLMGHAREMAIGSGLTFQIDTAAVPFIEGALEAIAVGAIPGGLLANREYAECISSDAEGALIAEDIRTLLYDPQTAGGLLVAVAAEDAENLLEALRQGGIPTSKIGRVIQPVAPNDKVSAIVLR